MGFSTFTGSVVGFFWTTVGFTNDGGFNAVLGLAPIDVSPVIVVIAVLGLLSPNVVAGLDPGEDGLLLNFNCAVDGFWMPGVLAVATFDG